MVCVIYGLFVVYCDNYLQLKLVVLDVLVFTLLIVTFVLLTSMDLIVDMEMQQ
jgi:hypothetical protein